jgi:predicted enzyme related to lactoylglutathione lyase
MDLRGARSGGAEMYASLDRIILYVQDVGRLTKFYKQVFELPVIEEIKEEWVVFRAGACELALHRVGKPYAAADASSWKVETNAKLVLSVTRDLNEMRAELIRRGVPMGDIKAYPGLTGPLCDGTDPEENIFQLAQVSRPSGVWVE